MGTMKLIAHDGKELKNIEFPELSIEEIKESLKELKEHEKDKLPKVYDYIGIIGPMMPIPQSVAEQYEKIASKYGKKIEGINYDECCTG